MWDATRFMRKTPLKNDLYWDMWEPANGALSCCTKDFDHMDLCLVYFSVGTYNSNSNDKVKTYVSMNLCGAVRLAGVP